MERLHIGLGAGFAFVLAMVGGLVAVAAADGAALVLGAGLCVVVAALAGWVAIRRLGHD